MRKGTHNRGFSLVELMIVVAILGMMLSVLIPQMMKAKYQAEYSGCQVNVRNLGAGLEIYRTDNKGVYPGDGALSVLWEKNYTNHPVCPTDPERKDYGYVTNLPDTRYTLYCRGLHLIGNGVIPSGYPEYTPDRGLLLPE